jgi:transmembrane sensor
LSKYTDGQGLSGSLQQEADTLVRRVRSAAMSEQETERALAKFGMAGVAHAEALARAERSWNEIRMVAEAYRAQQARQALDKARGHRTAVLRSTRRRLVLGGGLAFASAAAVAVALRPPWDMLREWSEGDADYRTATGEQRRVVLAGNMAVDLNTQTSLGVTPGADHDEVRLLAGEAAFTRTAQDEGKAVTVLAGAAQIPVRACGFEVRRLHESMAVTCLQGNVQLRHPGGTLVLRPDQQVVYDDTAIGEVRSVDPATTAAWRKGMLVFRDTPLREVLGEINRYRPGRVMLMNDALGQRLVNGQFRIAKLDEVILHLEDVFGAHVRGLPGGLMLVT